MCTHDEWRHSRRHGGDHEHATTGEQIAITSRNRDSFPDLIIARDLDAVANGLRRVACILLQCDHSPVVSRRARLLASPTTSFDRRGRPSVSRGAREITSVPVEPNSLGRCSILERAGRVIGWPGAAGAVSTAPCPEEA